MKHPPKKQTTKKKSAANKKQFASVDQVAEILNVTPRMVNRYVKEDGMPRIGRGDYVLVKCVHWYIEQLQGRINEAKRGGESEQQARNRLVSAQANLKEIELARLRAEVITVDDSIREFERVIRGIRSAFLSLPKSFALQISTLSSVNEIEKYLEERILRALSETAALPQRITSLAENQTVDTGDDRTPEAAAGSQGLGVV